MLCNHQSTVCTRLHVTLESDAVPDATSGSFRLPQIRVQWA